MHVEMSHEWTQSKERRSKGRVNPKYGRTLILIEAVSLERHRQLRLLLEAGVNANCRDRESGFTPLIQAMFIENAKQRVTIVKTLLSYGGEVTRADNQGRTAFSWACRLGRNDVLRHFLKIIPEAGVDSVDTSGNDNFILACMSGNPTTVRLIAEEFRRRRLDTSKRNGFDKTALMIAHEMRYYECVRVLVEEGYVATSLPKDILYGERQWSSQDEIKTSLNTTALPLIFSVYSDSLTNSFRRTGKKYK